MRRPNYLRDEFIADFRRTHPCNIGSGFVPRPVWHWAAASIHHSGYESKFYGCKLN
jgi:hypothetical protein